MSQSHTWVEPTSRGPMSSVSPQWAHATGPHETHGRDIDKHAARSLVESPHRAPDATIVVAVDNVRDAVDAVPDDRLMVARQQYTCYNMAVSPDGTLEAARVTNAKISGFPPKISAQPWDNHIVWRFTSLGLSLHVSAGAGAGTGAGAWRYLDDGWVRDQLWPPAARNVCSFMDPRPMLITPGHMLVSCFSEVRNRNAAKPMAWFLVVDVASSRVIRAAPMPVARLGTPEKNWVALQQQDALHLIVTPSPVQLSRVSIPQLLDVKAAVQLARVTLAAGKLNDGDPRFWSNSVHPLILPWRGQPCVWMLLHTRESFPPRYTYRVCMWHASHLGTTSDVGDASSSGAGHTTWTPVFQSPEFKFELVPHAKHHPAMMAGRSLATRFVYISGWTCVGEEGGKFLLKLTGGLDDALPISLVLPCPPDASSIPLFVPA